MTFDEMVDRFGSDKPDLRYGMELVDLVELFAGYGVQRLRLGLPPTAGHQGPVCSGRGVPEP